MAAPAVTEFTQDLFDELPEAYRTADEQLGWPLLRYLAVLGDQADQVWDQLRLLQAHEMADPAGAPAAWVDWMAQFVALAGAPLTTAEKRVAIQTGAGLTAGSLDSLRAAIEALLGGDKRYLIVTHDGGDPFKVHVYVNVDDAGGSTWDGLAVQFPSWNAWEAAGTWDNLATTAPIAVDGVLATVKPAWILLELETLGGGNAWLFLEEAVTTWDQWETEWATWDAFEGATYAWP